MINKKNYLCMPNKKLFWHIECFILTFKKDKRHKRAMTGNKYILKVKRPFVWLKRIRHRCGYGVHSPFAFSFITDVVYEKGSYYCYRTLHEQRRWGRNALSRRFSEKINRLLFRIANYCQPRTVVTFGATPSVDSYIAAARRSAQVVRCKAVANPSTALPESIDLLYVDADSAEVTEQIFTDVLPRLEEQSVCIVMGISYSKEMKQLWQRLKMNEKVGITFDLYDLGVIFFDRKKIKQHYIVNF